MVRVGDYQKVGDKLQEFTLERLLSKEMKMSSSHHQNEAVVNKLQTISRLLEKLDETCLKLKFLGKTKEVIINVYKYLHSEDQWYGDNR